MFFFYFFNSSSNSQKNPAGIGRLSFLHLFFFLHLCPLALAHFQATATSNLLSRYFGLAVVHFGQHKQLQQHYNYKVLTNE